MENNQNFITIVSGLPRSGTSMMMHMLHSGGMPVLADGFRKADDDNPLGYFEFEAVKKLDKDASWLPEACGKVVKIIHIFLYKLPPQFTYKVLFMKRNLEEVVASQKVMLRRRKEGDRLTDQQLMDSYSDQLQRLDSWIRLQKNFAVHYLNYGDVVAEPSKTAAEVRGFLGLPLDLDKMAQSVDPSLHRNRADVA